MDYNNMFGTEEKEMEYERTLYTALGLSPAHTKPSEKEAGCEGGCEDCPKQFLSESFLADMKKTWDERNGK